MQRWERRLADLGHILAACGSTYFDPELFRLNTNQFLTTARTVTFLIQKDKANIPAFERWHEEAILRPWSTDPVMKWAKDSRNHIEKEGDLDLYSDLSASLIYSYLPEHDIVLTCERTLMLKANLKRLMRFAEKKLPSGISDAAILKIERRWVANTLASHELLQALMYVYARIHTACGALAKHLAVELSQEIPDPTEFDELHTGSRRIQYVKFADRRPSALVGHAIKRDEKYTPPPWLASLADSEGQSSRSASLRERVNFFSKMAKGTFEQFGNHVPMLYLFDGEGKVIDAGGVFPTDQATKFIFWRSIAERIAYLRASSLIWISELWIRGKPNRFDIPIRKRPIIGEMLHVIGLDDSGRVVSVHWDIVRTGSEGKPSLVPRPEEDADRAADQIPYFLQPACRAFLALSAARK